MTALAAREMGYDVRVLDPEANCPASRDRDGDHRRAAGTMSRPRPGSHSRVTW